MRLLAAVFVLIGMCGMAHADPFELTFDQFRKALDQRIQDDTTDKSGGSLSTTKECEKSGNVYNCIFNDKGFQKSVAAFKKIDMINGAFTLKMLLSVEITDGKVSQIRLGGVKDDPANLFQYTATVTNVMQLFDPKIVDGEGNSLALMNELGIMRGDGDPTTGSPLDVIKPYAGIRCLNVRTKIASTAVCQWRPRS